MKQTHTFEMLYADYLLWFRERAKEQAVAWEQEEFPRFQSLNEDVFQEGGIVLNRAYYLVPLLPEHSRSGRLEVFAFSELNILFQNYEGDVILTAEYVRE